MNGMLDLFILLFDYIYINHASRSACSFGAGLNTRSQWHIQMLLCCLSNRKQKRHWANTETDYVPQITDGE